MLGESQPFLDCLIPKFKLKYDNLENIKTDRVSTVVFNLHQIKQSKFFGTPGTCVFLTKKFTSVRPRGVGRHFYLRLAADKGQAYRYSFTVKPGFHLDFLPFVARLGFSYQKTLTEL